MNNRPEKPKPPRNIIIMEGVGVLCNKEVGDFGCRKIKYHKGVCKAHLTLLERIKRFFCSLVERQQWPAEPVYTNLDLIVADNPNEPRVCGTCGGTGEDCDSTRRFWYSSCSNCEGTGVERTGVDNEQ